MGSERRNGSCVEDCVRIDMDWESDVANSNYSLGMPCEVYAVPSSPTASASSSSPARFIEHTVTRFDTLAGVAIKYGVEVADIKRMNSLVTDRQMFALKILQIPLPGRHPPSPCLSNGPNSSTPSYTEQTPPRRRSDILETLQSLRVTPERKVSPAMSSLQGYYGLKPIENGASHEGCEMSVYSNGSATYLEDGLFPKPSLGMNPPLSLHRKSRSLANGLSMEDYDLSKDTPPSNPPRNGWTNKIPRQHQNMEADLTSRTPEKLLKEENSAGGWFSAIAGKGLALRNKAGSRTNLATEADGATSSAGSAGAGDTNSADGFSVVRKSSSTSSLQDQDNGGGISIFSASKWSLKSDLQALSTSAIARPILDGFSKPITGRKNKAALD
ncbi:LysM and putative peptidoglycan-binding domain-containing protein [Drosera capensis]